MSLLLALLGGGGGPTYTLTADSGSFLLTGDSANLAVNRTLQAESGAFAVTGADATIAFNRALTADHASYTLTGTAATLAFNRALAADSATYTLNGDAAVLGFNRALTADSGSFTVTGADATLTYTPVGAIDVKVSWLAFDTDAVPCDVRVSWLAFDTAASPCDVKVSWVCLDTAATTGLRRFKHYRKGYLRRGNEVLVFDSEELAEQYEAAEIAAQQAISRAKRKKARAEIPKPVEKLNISTVDRQVKAWNIPINVQNIVAALDYGQLFLIQQRIADLQDEEDIELLLL